MSRLQESAVLGANILFDLDGTLVDSETLHDFAYRRALAEHLPQYLARYHYDAIKGRPTRESFAGLGIRANDELDALTSAKQRIYRAALLEGRLRLLPGAWSLLAALSATGHNLFLVTSGSRDSVMAALDSTGIEPFFTGIVTAADVQTGKPAPDPFLYCLERFGLAASACVVVEDSLNGVMAARRAGLAVIGVHDHSIAGRVDLFFPSLGDFEQWAGRAVSGTAVAP